MSLYERPAGQSMENPTSPSHRELRLGSPLADLDMSFKRYKGVLGL